MGMINDTTNVADPNVPMDPLLEKVEANIVRSVKPADNEAYQRIVLAGMKLAFDKTSHQSLMVSLGQSQDKVHDVAIGAVGLLLLMHKQSKGTMPLAPMVSAGMTLVLHGLDYIKKVYGEDIGNAQIDTATELFISTITPKLGVTNDVLNAATSKVHGAMQDPAFMKKFQQHASGGV